MEVKSIREFAQNIQGLSEDSIVKSIEEYTNTRVEHAVETAWVNIRKVWKYKEQKIRGKFRKVDIDLDDYTGMVSLVNFTRYISAIDDIIERLSDGASIQTRDALGSVQDELYQRLKSIKIDKRINYSKED